MDDDAETAREKAAELAQNVQSTAAAVCVLLTEHQFRGKLPQPFLLPSVRPGLLLRIRNAGGALRFQRRSLREGRRW